MIERAFWDLVDRGSFSDRKFRVPSKRFKCKDDDFLLEEVPLCFVGEICEEVRKWWGLRKVSGSLYCPTRYASTLSSFFPSSFSFVVVSFLLFLISRCQNNRWTIKFQKCKKLTTEHYPHPEE